MTIKEYMRKNYGYFINDKPAIVMVAGDCFIGDNVSFFINKREYEDLLDHQFVCLSRSFDSRNRESYLFIGRLDV